MTDAELSAELADLERRLIATPRVNPPPELGPRVLMACREVNCRTPVSIAGDWPFWVAVAAVVVVGINLSMSITAATEWNLAPAVRGVSTTTIDRMRELAPDLTEAELRRQALLVWAGRQLTPSAALPRTRDYLSPLQEPNPWDAH